MYMLDSWIKNNNLQDPDDVDALLEAAGLTRQLVQAKDYKGINTVIVYTIENDFYECFSWVISILQEEFEKEDQCVLDSFACDIGRSIAKYDNIYLISSENFDTKDNDYILYKIYFRR